MSLTSCEDILGEWSRPTPNPVTPGGGSSTIAVTGVKLNEAYLRFDKNVLTAQTLTATVEPADATDKTVTWKSSDETVATVDANGQVTPIKTGTVTIKATAGDKTATSTVYVYDKIVDISTDISVDADAYWLINGTGTKEDHSITIANNSKVTLNGINITKGINCTDNATIILADNSTNSVTAPTGKAGIIIGPSKTLTIDAETAGTGQLTAKGGSNGAGIGTNKNETGGNIVINGGTVNATGGDYGAGIGTGYSESGGFIVCGDITINGGTIKATGGDNAAGIGTGYSIKNTTSDTYNRCGNITIGADVTSVTATKGTGSPYSIGVGAASGGAYQICGTISIADPSKVTQN